MRLWSIYYCSTRQIGSSELKSRVLHLSEVWNALLSPTTGHYCNNVAYSRRALTEIRSSDEERMLFRREPVTMGASTTKQRDLRWWILGNKQKRVDTLLKDFFKWTPWHLWHIFDQHSLEFWKTCLLGFCSAPCKYHKRLKQHDKVPRLWKLLHVPPTWNDEARWGHEFQREKAKQQVWFRKINL